MDSNLISSKRVKFGIYESALASLLFVIYNFLFIQLYSFVPSSIKSNTFVNFVASFLLEFTFALAAITVALSKKIDLKKASGMSKKISGRQVWLGFWVSVACLLCFGDITTLFLQFLEMLGYNSILSELAMKTFWEYLGYVIVSCITPAICEELLFRGVILSGFKEYGAKIAIIISAIIFTFMHGNAEQTVHQFIIGVIVGYIFYKTGNLWLGVIIHFFNNFLSVTGAYLYSLLPQSEQVAEVVQLSAVDVIYSVISTALIAYFGVYWVRWLINKMFVEDARLNSDAPIENLNKQTITIDGQESQVEMTVDGEVTVADSDRMDSENNTEKKEELKPISTMSIVMFSIAGLYLAFEWLAALLFGFGVV